MKTTLLLITLLAFGATSRLPPQKDRRRFSQIGAESGWRTAYRFHHPEATKRGIELKFADAQQKQENQIKALRSFIAQGVDVIAFSPVVETGWQPVSQKSNAQRSRSFFPIAPSKSPMTPFM
jgi:simple sugar transport system substrate-binding protein